MDVTRADFEALPPTVQRKVSILLFLTLPHRYPTVFSMISPPSSLQKGEMAQGQINKQKGGGRNEKKKESPMTRLDSGSGPRQDTSIFR